ncbi:MULTISPECIES: phage holin family protein [Streptomyces]|uniref:Phage holin family protein n=1 Tax=Streptomyces xinghaiensis TaxID=1038928 RepID=A0A3R7F764_9ACTN|nr:MULTISPECIES: phage holin family protein [Streptomyces]PQM23529.1 phage holin family protein [Streptomyces xinghaiensis]RKM92195.1 phage holin family protein [Streptomyces xinghaiensis]RNC70166.1 phage holin family protein [Streptomyces xinghaiensis]
MTLTTARGTGAAPAAERDREDVLRDLEAGTAERAARRPGEAEPSMGELVSRVTDDFRRLLSQEIQLAKAELKAEGAKAGQAAGMFGGAVFAGYMVALFLSLTAVFALSNVMDPAWAALIVTALWAVAGGVLALVGRARTRQFSPAPEQTIETLKEDAEWARHPTHPTG